jgi:hypothetical protein
MAKGSAPKGGKSPGKGGKVKTVVAGNPKVVKAAKAGGGGVGSDTSPYSSARASLKGGKR